MQTEATKDAPVPTNDQAGQKQQQQKTDGADAAAAAAKDDKTDAVTSAEHKLAMLQLKMQEQKKVRAAEAAEAKKVAAELAKARRELDTVLSAAREAVGVGSSEEFERLAEEKRSQMRRASHTKAQDLLSTMYEWVNEAETPNGKAAISNLASNIQRFVGADKEVLSNNELLGEIMGSTEVLHTAKVWADKRVAAEQVRDSLSAF